MKVVKLETTEVKEEYGDYLTCPHCYSTGDKLTVMELGYYRFCVECLAEKLRSIGLKEIEYPDYY